MNMQKCALYIVVAIIFGALGFGFAKFCPLAAPKTVTVSQVRSINSAADLRTVLDAKLADLAKVLEQITDVPSAAKHRPAAEQLFLEIQLLTARFAMLPMSGDKIAAATSNENAMTDMRNQLQRLSKDEAIAKELNPGLAPLFHQFQLTFHTALSAKYSLLSTVQTLRSQIALYQLQHADNFPDFRKYGWKQLTYRTNTAGQISEANKLPNNATYGPYIIAAPQNPLTKSSEVLVLNSIPDNFKSPGSYGFVLDESRGRFFGLNTDGTLFDENAASADTR